MSSSSILFRYGLAAATALGFAAWSPQAQASVNDDDDSSQDDERAGEKSGKRDFSQGFFVGRFRRRGMYSSLTLGFANCADGRNGADCEGGLSGLAEYEVSPSFGFTKEIGYRIPWVFFGASYSLGFLRPAGSIIGIGTSEIDIAYQHSLLAVIRPTLPVWRLDLGLTLAPGWSRQVLRESWDSDKLYSQGFAMGVGVVTAFYITRGWIVGLRWDTIFNRHSSVCRVVGETKTCADIDSEDRGSFNMGLSGLYLSHRW